MQCIWFFNFHGFHCPIIHHSLPAVYLSLTVPCIGESTSEGHPNHKSAIDARNITWVLKMRHRCLHFNCWWCFVLAVQSVFPPKKYVWGRYRGVLHAGLRRWLFATGSITSGREASVSEKHIPTFLKHAPSVHFEESERESDIELFEEEFFRFWVRCFLRGGGPFFAKN